jgi:hypothetical protein
MKKIYITASWRHRLAVELLTTTLERKNYEIISFIREAQDAEHNLDIKTWIWSNLGLKKFHFDLNGATKSNLVIYIGSSGNDAWAEIGAAYASNVPIIGFRAKNEKLGLMHRMMYSWCDTTTDLLNEIDRVLQDNKGGE